MPPRLTETQLHHEELPCCGAALFGFYGLGLRGYGDLADDCFPARKLGVGVERRVCQSRSVWVA